MINSFTKFLVLVSTACYCLIAGAQIQLVTQAEAEASRNGPEQFIPKAVPAPGAPKISLKAPNINQPVPSPTAIRIQFKPTDPAVIRPESFQVLYGMFRVDITDRITGSTKVTPQGIDVKEAALPAGSHSLLVRILDSTGRLGQQWFEFKVK